MAATLFHEVFDEAVQHGPIRQVEYALDSLTTTVRSLRPSKFPRTRRLAI